MRQLRFLKQGEDGIHVIVETGDGGEQFALRVDAAIRDAVRSDLPRLHPSEPEPSVPEPSVPEPVISPREIQVRVRGGESPHQVAEETGMTLERVLRFAAPVLDERARMADEARRARARRSTTEGQTVVFGEAVDTRFGAHGIDPAAVRWDTHRREDGQWVITAHWHGGDADRAAEWAFHVSARNVTPLDDTAADLLSDRPIHPIVAPEPRPNLSSAPPLARGIVAFPAMPDAHTGPLPVVEDVFDQARYDDGAPRPEPAPPSGAPATPAAASAAPDADFDAPPLPLRLTETGGASTHRTDRLPRTKNHGSGARDGETDEQRAERAKIPSWDDILLGVRRKRD